MPAAMPTKSTGAGFTILVVDDDPRIVELLHIALGAHGYRVISANNGEDALTMAFQEQPDLVILDVRLPRRSGYEVCRSIRREPDLAHLPVIMISALGDTEARLQGIERGADDYLTKPFSPKELIAKVRRSLERAGELKASTRRARELAGELERAREELRRAHLELVRERQVKDARERLAKDLARLNRPEEMASTFLFALMTHLGSQSAALLMPDPMRPGILLPELARGLEPARQHGLALEEDGEMARLLVALGRPVKRDEMDRFPEMRAEVESLVAAGVALVVPVVARGRLAAVAVLGEKTDLTPYTGSDLEMAASLAQSATLAVEQADLLRNAENAHRQAVAAYLAAVEAVEPAVAARAERAGQVAEAVARELELEERTARALRLEAVTEVLDAESDGAVRPVGRLRESGERRDESSLEREILTVARAFVDLSERLEIGAGARQVTAHLQGDRQVLAALEDVLERRELGPARTGKSGASAA